MGPYKIGIIFAVVVGALLLLIILNVFGVIGEFYRIENGFKKISNETIVLQQISNYFYYYSYLNSTSNETSIQ